LAQQKKSGFGAAPKKSAFGTDHLTFSGNELLAAIIAIFPVVVSQVVFVFPVVAVKKKFQIKLAGMFFFFLRRHTEVSCYKLVLTGI
jgi:hypothetical protein